MLVWWHMNINFQVNMYNVFYLYAFLSPLEFKRQLSTLSEEDNQSTTPTSEHEHKMQCTTISHIYSKCTDSMTNFIWCCSGSDPRAPASWKPEASRATDRKRDASFGIQVVRASAGWVNIKGCLWSVLVSFNICYGWHDSKEYSTLKYSNTVTPLYTGAINFWCKVFSRSCCLVIKCSKLLVLVLVQMYISLTFLSTSVSDFLVHVEEIFQQPLWTWVVSVWNILLVAAGTADMFPLNIAQRI